MIASSFKAKTAHRHNSTKGESAVSLSEAVKVKKNFGRVRSNVFI